MRFNVILKHKEEDYKQQIEKHEEQIKDHKNDYEKSRDVYKLQYELIKDSLYNREKNNIQGERGYRSMREFFGCPGDLKSRYCSPMFINWMKFIKANLYVKTFKVDEFKKFRFTTKAKKGKTIKRLAKTVFNTIRRMNDYDISCLKPGTYLDIMRLSEKTVGSLMLCIPIYSLSYLYIIHIANKYIGTELSDHRVRMSEKFIMNKYKKHDIVIDDNETLYGYNMKEIFGKFKSFHKEIKSSQNVYIKEIDKKTYKSLEELSDATDLQRHFMTQINKSLQSYFYRMNLKKDHMKKEENLRSLYVMEQKRLNEEHKELIIKLNKGLLDFELTRQAFIKNEKKEEKIKKIKERMKNRKNLIKYWNIELQRYNLYTANRM
jgi:hypothetical protein